MNTDAPKTQELEPSILAMALLYAALLLGANLLVGGGDPLSGCLGGLFV